MGAKLGSQKPVFISSQLMAQERELLVALLQKYKDVFTWTYDEMPGLDPRLVVVKIYVFLMLRTYVTILCNWFIL